MASKAKIAEWFEAEGISIAEWSRGNGFNVRTVYAVLRGDLKGKRGISHRIAVALSLKVPPSRVGK